MNSRISLVLKAKNISSAQLADELGVQRSGISHILNGRNKPSLDFILRIIKKYPDISSNWLLFGEGPMMNPYPSQSLQELSSKTSSQKMLELFADTTDESSNNLRPDGLSTLKKDELSNDYQMFEDKLSSNQLETQNSLDTNNNKDAKSDIQLNNESHLQTPTKESHNSENKEYSNKPGMDRINIAQSQTKRIDRVIIFYNDKSFTEYYPE